MSPGDAPPSFGRFQLLQVVRQEGATTLHEALDPELGEKVALITSPVGPDAAEEDRLAFRLRRMRHPNVISVLDAGQQGDLAFVAAECLLTEPLSAFVARAGCMPLFQGLPLLLQLLSAIEHAQARRLVHGTIDLDHVQVTLGGQVKLPAAGWSLSSDRQPNLQAAARIGRVLLSGTCPPDMRRAFDDVLSRAEAPDSEAGYARADEFILALLSAAGYPVSGRTAAMPRAVPAQLEIATRAPETPSPVIYDVRRAPRMPLRRLPGRTLAAACLLAALLAPQLIGERMFTSTREAPQSAPTVALGAPPAAVPAATVALAPVAVPRVESAPAIPAPPAESSTASPMQQPVIAAPRAVAPHPVARTAVPQRPAATARPAPAARQAWVPKPAPTRAPAARPKTKAAPVLTAASGCPYDLAVARDLCEARLCSSRPELRQTPVCVRVLAEQRAALARLRGTPD